MTDTPYPDWPTDADLDATDRALDAVARRDPAPPDPALNALALLAGHFDVRAAALTRYAHTVAPAGRRRPLTTPGHVGTHRTVRPGSAAQPDRVGPRRRPRRPMRLFALPLVALLAITLTVVTAASGSPTTPLYPLHQLLFHQPPPDAVRQQLASAQQALDRAEKSSGADRLAALADARDHLTRAHDLMPSVSDAADRDQLDRQLSSLDNQAEQMDGSNDPRHDQNGQQQSAGTAPRGTGQRDDSSDHRRESPGSTASPSHRD